MWMLYVIHNWSDSLSVLKSKMRRKVKLLSFSYFSCSSQKVKEGQNQESWKAFKSGNFTHEILLQFKIPQKYNQPPHYSFPRLHWYCFAFSSYPIHHPQFSQHKPYLTQWITMYLMIGQFEETISDVCCLIYVIALWGNCGHLFVEVVNFDKLFLCWFLSIRKWKWYSPLGNGKFLFHTSSKQVPHSAMFTNRGDCSCCSCWYQTEGQKENSQKRNGQKSNDTDKQTERQRKNQLNE